VWSARVGSGIGSRADKLRLNPFGPDVLCVCPGRRPRRQASTARRLGSQLLPVSITRCAVVRARSGQGYGLVGMRDGP
jgi:hypothetical protein